MALTPGKDAVPLVASSEETAPPATVVGTSEIAFLEGPHPRRTIAIAAIDNGRIARRLPFDKGDIVSLSASPDGQHLYVAAGGTIWDQPVAGGEPRKIRPGRSAAIDPTGRRLLVQVIETPNARLFDVPLGGGPEREIPLQGPFRPSAIDPLNSHSLSHDGRLLSALVLTDSWFYPPGVVDLATGRMTQIRVDHPGDYHFALWTADGQVIAGANDWRSTLWRFQPDKP
jgi:hypothetical protein